MKKLSLLLLTIFVSVMGWAAATANPFAYDLEAKLVNEGTGVQLTYFLNAPATEDKNLNNEIGLQIYFYDVNDLNNYLWVYTGGTFKQGENTVTIPLVDFPASCVGKQLTWKVVVHGRKNTNPSSSDEIVAYTTQHPINAYGIAINNNQYDKRYAQIFVSEAYPNQRAGWNTNGTGDVYKYANTMLEYNPLMTYVCAHHKHKHNGTGPSHFASDIGSGITGSYNYEPNRVKISEDGRLFVSSFHPRAAALVLEYTDHDQTNPYNYQNVIDHNLSAATEGEGDNSLFRKRVIGLDVRGSGENLQLLLCMIDANGDGGNKAQLEVWEYDYGAYEKYRAEHPSDNLPVYLFQDPSLSTNNTYKTAQAQYVRKIGQTVKCDAVASNGNGKLYAGFNGGWQCAIRGFVDIAYGTNNDVWIKVDFANGYEEPGRIIRLQRDASKAPITKKIKQHTSNPVVNGYYLGAFYGGSAILVKDNRLITSTGEGKITAYKINQSTGNLEETNGELAQDWTVTENTTTKKKIGYFVTGLAVDKANNLYAVTEQSFGNRDFTANIITIPLSYSGTCSTWAPSEFNFTCPNPTPNILATNLKYEPAGTTDNYTFSFITNTKPTIAEIRFYRKENLVKMENNIATIHADNYNKANHSTQTPDYVYTFTENQRQRGLMSVTLRMVGGDANTKQITNALPPGEMYWSVYVETDKSSCFAPIYRSGFHASTSNYEPLHATVNNYPATDMFGSLIVTNNNEWNTEKRPTNGLLIYGLNPNGGNSTEDTYANSNRFVKKAEYLNQNNKGNTFLHYPRRMTVAPDGKVYISDEGHFEGKSNGTNYEKSMHAYGGVKLWDPTKPSDFTLFSDNRINTTTGLALYQRNNSMRLYVSNTYDEFKQHIPWGDYSKENQTDVGQYGWNGFVEYVVDKYTSNNASWSDFWSKENRAKEYALRRGDESGNMSLVAIEQGVWLCQYKDQNWDVKKATYQPLPDNLGSFVLSFVPYDRTESNEKYGLRTWSSCTTDGIKKPESDRTPDSPSELTQTSTSPLQSTPGAGMAYKKTNGKEYLYVVNHNGNIVRLEITSWTGTGVSATPSLPIENVKVLLTPSNTKHTKDVIQGNYTTQWKNYAFINSMEFDYAGNLVTVTGDGMSHNAKKHEIIVYTMPYDRTNAQEIRAPESCIYIPERLHQIGMDKDIQDILDKHHSQSEGKCAIDLYRPLQGGMFNTICLPFTVPMDHENNPLAGSEVREFTRATIESIGGENILCLEFEAVAEILFNVPYIIKPQQNIKQIMRFNWPVTLAENTKVNPETSNGFDNGNTIIYQGILPQTKVSVKYDEDGVTPLTLILVAENRLAELLPDAGQTTGTINGLRGYFQLAKKLSNGTILQITPKQSVSTSTTIIVDGKRVNIEKYLREGRVYIRMGDSLYTITGEKVK